MTKAIIAFRDSRIARLAVYLRAFGDYDSVRSMLRSAANHRRSLLTIDTDAFVPLFIRQAQRRSVDLCRLVQDLSGTKWAWDIDYVYSIGIAGTASRVPRIWITNAAGEREVDVPFHRFLGQSQRRYTIPRRQAEPDPPLINYRDTPEKAAVRAALVAMQQTQKRRIISVDFSSYTGIF